MKRIMSTDKVNAFSGVSDEISAPNTPSVPVVPDTDAALSPVRSAQK